MKKGKKIALIISLSVVGTIVTYFALGLIATPIVFSIVIDVRGGELEDLDSDPYYVFQKIRKDYDLMENRKEVSFTCNEETLMGYLYEVNSPQGIIICAHGVNSLADGNFAQFENYYLSHNWNIFAIDMTGCGKSSGKGMKTLHESKYCVQSAIDKVKTITDLPIFLIGHSWGGYGVIAGSDCKDIKAVAAFSSYNIPGEMTYASAINYVSPLLALTKPSLDLSLHVYYGNEEYVSCSSIVRNNKDTQYIIIHGENDDVVPFYKYSTYDAIKDLNLDNVSSISLENIGHIGPWRSVEAHRYFDEEVMINYDKLLRKYDNDIPDAVYQSFISTIDKDKTSELNIALLEKLEDIFLHAI